MSNKSLIMCNVICAKTRKIKKDSIFTNLFKKKRKIQIDKLTIKNIF